MLSFARALGEFGATTWCPLHSGKTATVSTTVYQLWRTGEDLLAYKRWRNIAISFAVLVAICFIERRDKSACSANECFDAKSRLKKQCQALI